MEYKPHKTVNPYLQKIKRHKKPYTHKVLGKEIVIYPNVMSPKYDWSSTFHISNMPNQKDKSFLEIGSGCGVISLFAVLQGANKVVAVDINRMAVKNIIANFQKYNFSNYEAFYSDVFTNVKGRFDTITFNAPYHRNKPKNILEYGVFDPQYRALRLFMKGARKYLKKDGQIVLGFSNTGNLDLLHTLIIENKFLVKKRYQKTKKGWIAYLYILEPIYFETKMQEYIYNDDYKWFKKYKPTISSGKVLKVGVGLGYASYFISLFNQNIINIDIQKNKRSIVKNNTTIYGGLRILFPNNSFDTVICTYTLHHSNSPKKLLSELIRTSKKNVVIVEETYKGIFSKLSLIYNDIKVNLLAKQKVDFYASNYFKKRELEKIFKKENLKINYHKTFPKLLYTKEIFLITKKKH